MVSETLDKLLENYDPRVRPNYQGNTSFFIGHWMPKTSFFFIVAPLTVNISLYVLDIQKISSSDNVSHR